MGLGFWRRGPEEFSCRSPCDRDVRQGEEESDGVEVAFPSRLARDGMVHDIPSADVDVIHELLSLLQQ